ncbi:MAG: hypothetical protein WBL72_03015, partial [Thermoguttaceae bacterium]
LQPGRNVASLSAIHWLSSAKVSADSQRYQMLQDISYTLAARTQKVGFASTASCVFPEKFDASICHLWAFFNGLLSDC